MEADVDLDEGYTEEPGLRFRDQEVPCEILNLDRGKDGALPRCRLGFIATIPPTGYRVFRLAEKKEPRQNRIEFRDRRVMTPYFDLEVNPENGILQVWNKEGRQILRGNEIVIDEEIGDLYFHHSRLDRPIGSESGGGLRFAAFKPEEFKIEQGPVRTVITFKDAFYCLRWPYYLTEYFGPQIYRHKTVDITKLVIVYENLPRIDFVTTLHLQQSHVRIRLKFDTCMVAHKYTRQTQFGVIDLPHSRTLAEGVKAPSLSWVNGEEGDRGLAFLSCGVPIQRHSCRRDLLHAVKKRLGSFRRRVQRAVGAHARRAGAGQSQLRLFRLPARGGLEEGRNSSPRFRIQPSTLRLPDGRRSGERRTRNPDAGAVQFDPLLAERKCFSSTHNVYRTIHS